MASQDLDALLGIELFPISSRKLPIRGFQLENDHLGAVMFRIVWYTLRDGREPRLPKAAQVGKLGRNYPQMLDPAGRPGGKI